MRIIIWADNSAFRSQSFFFQHLGQCKKRISAQVGLQVCYKLKSTIKTYESYKSLC